MKKVRFVLVLCFLIPGMSFAEMRTWTSASGSVVKAEYQRRNGAMVVLQTAGGKTIRFPYAKLSPVDRSFVDELGSMANPAKANTPLEASISPEIKELIGSSRLYTAKGKRVDATKALSGKKAIGLYYSAH